MFPFPFFAGSTKTLTYSFVISSASKTNLTTYTFSGVSIGTETSDRTVFVCISGNGNTTTDVSSCTIGGISATKRAESPVGGSGAGTPTVSIWEAQVTGTTANIVVTFAGGKQRCAIDVYAVYGTINSYASYSSGKEGTTAALSVTVLTPSVGDVVIGTIASNTGGVNSWTGLTEDTDTLTESALNMSSAAVTTTSSSNLAVTAQTTNSSYARLAVLHIK